jgi:hypothetical protein
MAIAVQNDAKSSMKGCIFQKFLSEHQAPFFKQQNRKKSIFQLKVQKQNRQK